MLRCLASRIVFCAALCVLPFGVLAQSNQCKVNGCGPDGVLGSLIPNGYRGYFVRCKFKNACDEHDKCYSNCMKCSSWYGTERCKEKSCWFSWDNSFKDKCDEQLYKNITLANLNNQVCDGFASAYKAAVQLLGCGFYYGQTFSMQKQLQFQKNFDALMQFYEYHRKHQIRVNRKALDAFVRQLSHSPAVDQNVFDFSIKNGVPMLSVDQFSAVPAGAPKNAPKALSDDFSYRKYINGIDVTHMRDDYNSFDKKNLQKSAEPFDFKIELEVKQGNNPAVPRKFDYKTFNDLRNLRDLEKLKPVN